MSQENPTPEELDEIEQFQHGAYGAEPPEWWLRQIVIPGSGKVSSMLCRWFRHRWHYGPDFRICLTCKEVQYP